jgi:hypothetical protein
MRTPAFFLALGLATAGLATAAGAQPAPDAAPAPPGPAMSMSGPGGHAHTSLRAKFEAANVTHDGKLTLQQAQDGGLRKVAKHFAEIDRDNKGFVTLQDIGAWQREHQAEKAAARQGQQQPAAGAPAPEAAPPAGNGPQY